MTDVLLGLDVGTTATKTLAFDTRGHLLASSSYQYSLLMPHEGWVEQDPEELWRAVVVTVRAVVSQLKAGDRVVALSQSSQGGTTIPVDASGCPTYNAISWMDRRAVHETQDWLGADQTWLYSLTGWGLNGSLPLNHIMWMRKYLAAEFSATRHFLFVNDFIGRRLTGQLCMNPSDAGITQLMSVAAGDWDARLLQLAGIAGDQLSPIRPSGYPVGTLLPAAAEATGLPANVLLVNGAHDQYCAAVGAGVTQPGHVLLSCGTAWVILAVPPNLEIALTTGMGISRHALEGRYGAIRSLGGVGASLEWLLDQVWAAKSGGGEREALYSALNESAAGSPPGARGLMFLPLACVAESHGGSDRGGFVGLALQHTRGDMARAVMEGVAFELRGALEDIRRSGVAVTRLKMVGGAAMSTLWPQIVAGVCDVPVVLSNMRQAAGRGAAILAGVGAGVFTDAEAGFAAFSGEESVLEPNAPDTGRYAQLFTHYQDLVQCLARPLGNLAQYG